MRENINTYTKTSRSKVQCIEVLIPKNRIANNIDNLFWKLSVYSLENQPVKTIPSSPDSEVFHFMVYDWKRTIKRLLGEHKVSFSILQYFAPESVYADVLRKDAVLQP